MDIGLLGNDCLIDLSGEFQVFFAFSNTSAASIFAVIGILIDVSDVYNKKKYTNFLFGTLSIFEPSLKFLFFVDISLFYVFNGLIVDNELDDREGLAEL
jgi:hypothetical protein